MLIITGFVFFVASLEKGHYKFQFTQFAWTHMALYLIVVQTHFIINNIFEGMIWFFLPASLVVTNDIFAYICGITFGRTQLIKLSPKKTVEGFLGAWVFTILFGYGLTNLLMQYKYFVCPVNVSQCERLQTSRWRGRLTQIRIWERTSSRVSNVRSTLFSYLINTRCRSFRQTGHICPHRSPLREYRTRQRRHAADADDRQSNTITHLGAVDICFSHRALWRLLCFGTQAYL